MTKHTPPKRNWIVASWNINSIRLRKELVARFLKSTQPDFLCLQEIKCTENEFPVDFFSALGYEHQLLHGQKAYHGVAIISRHPFVENTRRQFGERKQDSPHARHIYGSFQTASGVIGLHNFYVPSGGGSPDIENNPKFVHKLRFVKSMKNYFGKTKNINTILVGDLNIAPHENDVWSHEKLKRSIGHSPLEIQHLNELKEKGDFIDVARHFSKDNKKLYSWWSYRTKEWQKHNYGWRLDHIWTSPDLIQHIQTYKIQKLYRAKPKPSDHVPILIEITL